MEVGGQVLITGLYLSCNPKQIARDPGQVHLLGQREGELPELGAVGGHVSTAARGTPG